MPHLVRDRVRETTTTTGTGAVTLAGAVSGFRAFSAVMANADTAWYAIVHQSANEWEVGLGTWSTGGTLSRTTVLASSNAGAAVDFSAGTKDVFLTQPGPTLPRVERAFLTATQANSTVTPAVLTGHTFLVPPGGALSLQGVLVCTAAATTTGFSVGVRVTQPASANGNARGAFHGLVNLANAAGASALTDGDVFNVAANANALVEVLGTATTAGNNGAAYQAVIENAATNAWTTVTVEFRSEVASSAVTAQIGSGAIATVVG
jgi:hypothetical protein